MKRICIVLLCFAVISRAQAQDFQVEALAGISGYSGDFTHKDISTKSWHPGGNLNFKYQFTEFIGFRLGLGYGSVSGDDKNGASADVRARNLNFKTDIMEANFVVEINLLSPDLFDSYPYVFGGVGLFHFNPYTNDNSGVKTYLQPLSTEGEGLPEYPGRKAYNLTQFCIPFGAGVKKRIDDDFDIAFEGGVRKLFTDYLDDLSNSYIDRTTLLNERGAKAVELAFRTPNGTYPHDGQVRGGPKKKDLYYFMGFKLIYHLGGGRSGPFGQPQPERYRY